MPHSKVLEICCVLNVKSVGGVTDVPKEDDSLWLSCVVEGEFAAPGAELHPTLPSSTVQHKITERSLFISSHHFEITVEYAHSSAAAAFGIIRRAAYTTVSVSGRPSNAQADVLIRVAVVIGNSHFVGIAHQSIAIVIPQTASHGGA